MFRRGGGIPLPIGGEGQTGADVFTSQVGEIAEDIVLRHPGREVFQDLGYGDPQAPDAGLAAALARLDRDPGPPVH